MNARKVFLGLALVGVLGLVLWQVTRRSPPAPAQHVPAATADAPPVTPAHNPPPGNPVAPTDVAAVPLTTPVLPSPATSGASPAAPMDGTAPVTPLPLPALLPQVQSEANPELVATARMYAAHASLRASEVADPDSQSNRQILRTMIDKSLAHVRSTPSTPPAIPSRSPQHP